MKTIPSTFRPSIRLLIFLFFILLNLKSSSQPQVLWKFNTGAAVYGTAAIHNQMVYFGSGNHSFYALNKISGKLIWEYKTKGAVHSDPLIYEDKVIFSSADGKVYALDQRSGQLLWSFTTKGEQQYDAWDYYLSSPVVAEGRVYIGSGDSSVYALDLQSGKKIWSFKTGGIVHATPVIKDKKVLIGSYDGFFYALDTQSGQLIWKFKTVGDLYFPKGEIQKAASTNESSVFFGSRDYNLYSLSLKTGTGQWNRKEGGSWIIATPLLDQDQLYVGTSDTHQFHRMGTTYGDIKWTLPLNMRVYGAAVMMNKELVFGCFNGRVYFVNPETGKVNTSFQTEESKKHYAALFDENDKVRKDIDPDGKNYLEVEKRILALGAILASPKVDQDLLYFGDANGFFYALKR
ncbi:PQQ-binding-like beta-propeller repeat protein [Pedobacter gandavensis]|uniref:outer membrane protein assembly factor BamB family protein n=1 Tax=Pedobacter gandavensis TaxID=2679963 RepID=UPI00292F6692|nr:PQQ-binding-like beta-propeller repeat protein [Pedobacter gandavensis]